MEIAQSGGTLTVEFAGICTLVRTKNKAEVLLVNVKDALRAAGHDDKAAQHSAILSVATIEHQSDCHRTVCVPGDPREYAVWDLSDSEVEFWGVNVPPANGGEKASGIAGLISLNEICYGGKPAKLKSNPSLACRVSLPTGATGAITGLMQDPTRRIEFRDASDHAIVAARSYAPRFQLRLDFKDEARIKIKDRESQDTIVELKFKKNAAVLIGNLCHEVASAKNHFYAHYTLLEGGRELNVASASSDNTTAPSAIEHPGAFDPFWMFCNPAEVEGEDPEGSGRP